MPTVVVDIGVPFDREALLADFAANDIDGRVFFWPLSMLDMFDDRPQNSVSYGMYGRALNLPTYHDLTDHEIDRVCGVVRTAIQCARVVRSEGLK
jgi:perosamine synthetase